MPVGGETKTIISEPLTKEQVKELREAIQEQNDYIERACTVLSAMAGAKIGGVIGAGVGAYAGNKVASYLLEDTDYINDILREFGDGEISNMKTKTVMKYRSAGRNSGWYVKSSVVIGVK